MKKAYDFAYNWVKIKFRPILLSNLIANFLQGSLFGGAPWYCLGVLF